MWMKQVDLNVINTALKYKQPHNSDKPLESAVHKYQICLIKQLIIGDIYIHVACAERKTDCNWIICFYCANYRVVRDIQSEQE